MKKWIIVLLGLPLTLLITAAIALALTWSTAVEPRLRAEILRHVREKAQAKATLGPIQIRGLWPPQIALTDLAIDSSANGYSVAIPMATLRLDSPLTVLRGGTHREIAFVVILQSPRVRLLPPTAQKPPEDQATPPTSGNPTASLPRLRGRLVINGGSFAMAPPPENPQATPTTLDDLNLTVQSNGFLHGEPIGVDLGVKAHLAVGDWSVDLPISFKTESLTFSYPQVAAQTAQLDVAGLNMNFSGSTDVSKMEQKWRVEMKIADLAKLPAPPKALPAGTWKGALAATVDIAQSGKSPPLVKGRVSAQGVQGNLDWKHGDLSLKGPLSVDSEADFQYQEQADIQRLVFKGDFTGLEIVKESLFEKPAGVALTLSADGSTQNNRLVIREANAQFHRLKSFMQGAINQLAGQTTDFTVAVPETSLVGMETFFPPLREFPLKGQMALSLRIQGDVHEPTALRIQAQSLKLENISGNINFKRAAANDQKIELAGPFNFSLSGPFTVAGTEIKEADLKARADLTAFRIEYLDLYRKEPGEKLSFQLAGKKAGERFVLNPSDIFTPFGAFQVYGSLANPTRPDIVARVRIKDLNLTALTATVGPLKAWSMDGRASGQIGLRGVYVAGKAPLDQDFSTDGAIQYQIPKFVMPVSETPPPTEPDPNEEPPPALPLMPASPLLEKLNLRLAGTVGEAHYKDVIVRRITSDVSVARGTLSGRTDIGQVFGAQVKLSNLVVPLRQAPARMSAKTEIKNLDLHAATAWALPAHKDALKGFLAANFSFSNPLPGHGQLVKESAAEGNLNVTQFHLSTLKLDEMINEILGKIPGPPQKISTNGVSASLKSKFKFAQERLGFQDLHLVTGDGHELHASGVAGFDKSLRMKGKLFISNLRMAKTERECLLDKDGRLEIPVEYYGSLTEPKYGYGVDVLQNLITKYGSCRAKMVVKEAEQAAQSALKRETEKQTDALKEKAKKKLKELFR